MTGAALAIVEALDDEVDVVLSGHAHSFTNALVSTAGGKEILVTQAWSAGTAYADVDLTIDPVSLDVVEKTAQIITTYADAGAGLTPDAEVAELVAQAEYVVEPVVNQVIGTAQTDITRTANDAGEEALGNLIADAMVAEMVADFAFMNPGGIRADIAAGEITWGDLQTVQPFNNTLARMNLTGQQIYDLLEQQWVDQPYTRMLQISGLTYTWDNALPEGGRIVEVRKDGTPIDRTAIYAVVTNSYLADGGDNFSTFKQGTDKIIGPVDLDALVDYVSSLSQPFSAAIEGRITRLN
jgi:5'-nucleotidase